VRVVDVVSTRAAWSEPDAARVPNTAPQSSKGLMRPACLSIHAALDGVEIPLPHELA